MSQDTDNNAEIKHLKEVVEIRFGTIEKWVDRVQEAVDKIVDAMKRQAESQERITVIEHQVAAHSKDMNILWGSHNELAAEHGKTREMVVKNSVIVGMVASVITAVIIALAKHFIGVL